MSGDVRLVVAQNEGLEMRDKCGICGADLVLDPGPYLARAGDLAPCCDRCGVLLAPELAMMQRKWCN